MYKGTVISLCDLTGIFVQPWVDAGYRAVLVDPQHVDTTGTGGRVEKIADTIIGALPRLGEILKQERVVFVAGFPPCTDVAVSGARHFKAKAEADTHFQTRAAMVAEQCRVIGMAAGCPWFFENPVSVFSSVFGKPQHQFHPWHYGGYLPEEDSHPVYPRHIQARDAYPKLTCLWSGGGFIMPRQRPVDIREGYSDQFLKLGGKSEKTKNIRSATPRGFSLACFLANKPKDQ